MRKAEWKQKVPQVWQPAEVQAMSTDGTNKEAQTRVHAVSRQESNSEVSEGEKEKATG